MPGLHSESIALSGSNGPRSIVGSEAALCLVDIDKPDVQLPEEVPIFPHRTPFIEELNHVLDKHQVSLLFVLNVLFNLVRLKAKVAISRGYS